VGAVAVGVVTYPACQDGARQGRFRGVLLGWGTSSRKLTGPAPEVDDVGRIGAVLLSHDHHADNLDDAGRTRRSLTAQQAGDNCLPGCVRRATLAA